MSKSPKMTPIFPASVKPARSGVYRAAMNDFYARQWKWARWDARRGCWYAVSSTPEGAKTQKIRAAWQNKPWRGLAQDPSTK